MRDQGPQTGSFRVLEVHGATSVSTLLKAGGFRYVGIDLLTLFPLEPIVQKPEFVPVNFDVLDEEVDSIHALPLIRSRFNGKPPRFRVALEFAAKYPDFRREEPLVVLVPKADGSLGEYVAELSFCGEVRTVRPVPVTVHWSKTRRYLFEL